MQRQLEGEEKRGREDGTEARVIEVCLDDAWIDGYTETQATILSLRILPLSPTLFHTKLLKTHPSMISKISLIKSKNKTGGAVGEATAYNTDIPYEHQFEC